MVEFLRVRKVPLTRFEYPNEDGTSDKEAAMKLSQEFREIVKKDRDLHERVSLLLKYFPSKPAFGH